MSTLRSLALLLSLAFAAIAQAEISVVVLDSHFDSSISAWFEGYTDVQSRNAGGSLWVGDPAAGRAIDSASLTDVYVTYPEAPIYGWAGAWANVWSDADRMRFAIGVDGMQSPNAPQVRRGDAQVSTSTLFRLEGTGEPVEFIVGGAGYGPFTALLVDQTANMIAMNLAVSSPNYGQTWHTALLADHTYSFQTFAQVIAGGDPWADYDAHFTNAQITVLPAPGAVVLGLVGLGGLLLPRRRWPKAPKRDK